MTRQFRILAISLSTFLIASLANPIQANSADASALVTCTSLTSGTERISRTGNCRMGQEAQANWHRLALDSTLPNPSSSKQITVCSNKPSSPVTYIIIRRKCAGHQVREEFYRSKLPIAAPVVLKVVATGYNSAQISLTKIMNANPDAPVAFYTITSNRGQSKSVYSWGELNLTIDNLNELTTYSFTVTATTVDGTSKLSDSTEPVTTLKYVAPAPAKISSPVAQVSLLSNDTASVTIPAGATSVAVVAPTLGNPSLSFGSQGATISATITSSANPAGGISTPFTVSGSTKIVDIAVTGLSGSATVCLDASPTAKLWHYVSGTWVDITTSHTSTQVCGLTSSFSPFTGEDQIASPAITISSNAETKTVGSAINGFTVTNTGGAIASYSISPNITSNPGLSFNSSTGRITGTPTSARAATTYTVTGINGSGSSAVTFTVTAEAAIFTVGQTGPGGGKVFYVAPTPFACGPTLNLLCSYLEAAPRTWASAQGDVKDYWIAGNTEPIYRTIPDAQGLSIGTGYKNSLAIQNRNPDPSAATRSLNYRGGGLSDWYLMSAREADEFWRQNAIIDYTGGNWWTSSEEYRTGSNALYFAGNYTNQNNYEHKTSLGAYSFMYFRPIRAF